MKAKKERKFTLRLTESQYQKLEGFAKAHDTTMSKVLTRYIGRLPRKSEKTESNNSYQEET